ncbi:MAG: adenosine kinase [Actinomycetota bacterium]|nr:adenosine kinase [Actinomycetota bacterium]
MSEASDIDVIGIGNALVDVITHEDDDFLAEFGLAKGTMHLIDEARAQSLYDAMGPGIQMSGGAAANTAVGVASFGGSAHYVGKVRDDDLGEAFGEDLRSTGVGYDTEALAAGPSTGRCLILVTPDAQRTMNTFLGASVVLRPEDVDEALIARGTILFLEGYLFDPPAAQEAFRVASRMAHAAGRRVALSLCDPFCVDRHRQAFRDLVEHHVDVLFANESEICSLYELDDFDDALRRVRGVCEIAALTRGERGSLVVTSDEAYEVDAVPVERLVDTTGAGDLYAAGFLYGLSHGHDLPSCGRLGSLAAAEVISHVGARPATSLAEIAASDSATGPGAAAFATGQ